MKNARFIHVHEARATAFMLLSSACWGMGTVMSKGVLGQIPPFTLLAIQLGSSVTFLGIVTLLKHPWKIQLLSGKDFFSWQMFRFSIPGLLEPGVAYTLGHVGLMMTTAANTLLINALEPVITMSLAWILLGEKVEILMLLTSLIAIAGVLISLGFDPQLSSGMFLGDLLVLMGTASASLYVVLSYHGVKKLEPLTLALMQQSFGLFWIVSIWLILERGEWYTLIDVDLLTWLSVVGSGLIHFALAFWLYLEALRGFSASAAAQFVVLIPIFGICGAYLFLGEQITIFQGIGSCLTLFAVYATTKLDMAKEEQKV